MKLLIEFANGDEREYETEKGDLDIALKTIFLIPYILIENEAYKTSMIIKVTQV